MKKSSQSILVFASVIAFSHSVFASESSRNGELMDLIDYNDSSEIEVAPTSIPFTLSGDSPEEWRVASPWNHRRRQVRANSQLSTNSVNTTNGINYWGGAVMMGTPHIYYIWYGSWSGNTAKTILPNFATHLSGSPYLNINTTYTNGSGQKLSNTVKYSGAVSDNYSLGNNLSDSDVQKVVLNQIKSRKLPNDPNGVYFVLTSADVKETSGFCTNYCGWHNHANYNGNQIKYSFVGNPDQCPSACAPQTTSPNGNAGADAMTSIIAHEYVESTTDPLLSAWFDNNGSETADKCAWTFGSVSVAPNGSYYNVTLGGSKYLIQQNWVNAGGGYCGMKY